MKIPCRRCLKEMIPKEDFPDERWCCECGMTARLEDKGRVDRLYKSGRLKAVAERGKRIIFPFEDWDENRWLIYEEPIE